jgi:hypothetical protein
MQKIPYEGSLTITEEAVVWVPLFQHGNSWIPDVEVDECVVDEDEDGARNINISLKAIVDVTPVVRNG